MGLYDYVKDGWGSYKEFTELSMRDIAEIRISIESRMQEEKLAKSLGG